MHRIGKISSVNIEKNTVRVVFNAFDNIVSDELALICPRTLQGRVARVPKINENVLCVFLEDSSDGFCLGSFSTDEEGFGNKESLLFNDGTLIEYDAETHQLTANVQGSIQVTSSENAVVQATNLEIQASSIRLVGNVSIEGSIDLGGSVTCPDKCTCPN